MVRRRKWATGFGVIAVVAVLVGLTTAGANAQQNRRSHSHVNATLYMSGSAWGPLHQLQPVAPAGTRPARSGCSTRRRSATTRSRTSTSRGSRPSGKWVGRTYVMTPALRREVERRQAADRRGREVHVRDRQARRLGALDDVEDRALEHPRQGQHGQLRLHGQAELPRLEHQHLLVRHRAPAHLEELQRDRDHDRQHATSTWSAPARSPTVAARARP